MRFLLVVREVKVNRYDTGLLHDRYNDRSDIEVAGLGHRSDDLPR